MSKSRSDLELLEAWSNGDLAAGFALFERNFDSLYRFFCNKVGADCRDLVQQTLLACVEGRARFRGEASFRTYLFQTARYQLYAYFRKRSKYPQVDVSEVSMACLGTSPSRALGRRQDARLLLEGLRQLPIECQLVLELSFWEELSSPEIADIIGVSDAAVRGRLKRATERLKREMDALTGERLRETAGDLSGWAEQLREGAARQVE